MQQGTRWAASAAVLVVLGAVARRGEAQIDPVQRDLIHLGWNQPIEGHAPLGAYGYYYLNRPEFVRSNLTLRAAISPVYMDAELGLSEALGPRTDVGLGMAGGGFAYSYDEIRSGKWYHEESFSGHGAAVGASVYHRFNPEARIPLYGVVRGQFAYATYLRDDLTAPDFDPPRDQPMPVMRAGVRLGGQEPKLEPDLALELSGWYEAQFRVSSTAYGYAGDRRIEEVSHLFWGRAGVIYRFPESGFRAELALNAGTSIDQDRFSAYRMGGMLPLAAEFPFAIPGYYHGELSARNFMLAGGHVSLPIDHAHRWSLGLGGVTGRMAYTWGLEQPATWHTGVGALLTYAPPSKVMKWVLAYGYGIDAIRSSGRGANSIAVMVEIDLERTRPGAPEPGEQPGRSSFLQRLMRIF